jgi:polar amino acid transport system substrate-binding protein
MRAVWGIVCALLFVLATGPSHAAAPRAKPRAPATHAGTASDPSVHEQVLDAGTADASPSLGGAVETNAAGKRVLRVGTVASEPFIIFDENTPEEKRTVEGLSADLWREIALRMNVETRWVFFKNMTELTDAVKSGKIDAGIAAITISKEREAYADFSNSMYESGLRILTRAQSADTGTTMRNLFKKLFWNTNTLLIVGMLVFVAHLVWYFNRWRNSDFVPRPYLEGIREAMRWSAQILIGVGGTPIPKKGFPWVIGIVWVFGGKLLFVVLTGVFSAAFALAAVGDNVNNLNDLKGKRTAVVSGNAPEKYMERINTTLVRVSSVKDGIEQVASGQCDAFVHDAPRLQFWRAKVNQREGKELLRVTPEDFNRQNYGIVFPSESRLRKEVNVQLLNLREPKNPGERSFYDEARLKWIPQ